MKQKFWISIAIVSLLAATLPAMNTAQKVTRILAMKRIQFEFSIGSGLERVSGLPERGKSVEALMRQYADLASSSLTEEGRLRENFLRLPLRIAVAYRLNPQLSVKGGLGFSTGSLISEKGYILEVLGAREKYDFRIQDKLVMLSPFVEVEKRFGRFSAFAGLGVRWGRLTHLFDSSYSDNAYSSEINEKITASGIGPMIYLGGAYRHPLGDDKQLMARLEVRIARINSWSGDKSVRETDSLGGQIETSQEGDLVAYETDPYGSGWVSSWDVGPIAGDSGFYRNVAELSSDFTGIRLTLGICF